METSCGLLCMLWTGIDWLWYAVAVVTAFAVGGLWYSALFSKMWIRVFKVDMPGKVTVWMMLRSMLIQFLATAILGLLFFMLTGLSVWLSVIALVVFCGWQKAGLGFQFPASWKNFVQAALIQAGYTFIAGLIFILFALV